KCSKRHTDSARGSFSNTAAENTVSSKTEGRLVGTQGDARGTFMISAWHQLRNAKTLNALPCEGGIQGGEFAPPLGVRNPIVPRSSSAEGGPDRRGPSA